MTLFSHLPDGSHGKTLPVIDVVFLSHLPDGSPREIDLSTLILVVNLFFIEENVNFYRHRGMQEKYYLSACYDHVVEASQKKVFWGSSKGTDAFCLDKPYILK